MPSDPEMRLVYLSDNLDSLAKTYGSDALGNVAQAIRDVADAGNGMEILLLLEWLTSCGRRAPEF